MKLQDITNLINERGNAAANQHVITTDKATYFKSYKSVVAKIDKENGKVTLSSHWDYSNTTRKHLYVFLRQRNKSNLLNWSKRSKADSIRKAIAHNQAVYRSETSLKIV